MGQYYNKATLKRALYSSEGCPTTFNAQVVHTFDNDTVCGNIEAGAETIYFIESTKSSL